MFENLSIKYLLKIENLKFKIGVAASFFILLISISAIISKNASAASSYVLPYPSVMPGSKFYQIRIIWGEIKKYWHFGDFSQFQYNLKQSDKYLVEAKTLFEYKQYSLGFKALQNSNIYFSQVYPYLVKAKRENKNIKNNLLIFKDASLKHDEVLNSIKLIVPEVFVWAPEKKSSSTLHLKELIDRSIDLRNKYL